MVKKFLIALIITIITFIGCSVKKEKIEHKDDVFFPVSSVFIGNENAQELNGKLPIHLYFKSLKTNKLEMEVRYVTIENLNNKLNDFVKIVIEELLKGTNDEVENKNIIPKDTRLISLPQIEGDSVTINLSKEFMNNLKNEDSECIVYSIGNTLTEIKEINKVFILVDNKKINNYGNVINLNEGILRNVSLLK